MYRGSNILFNEFIIQQDAEALTAVTSSVRRGRSDELNKKRNEFLLHRYYFYVFFFNKKLSYTFIIERIANETFLSPVTVSKTIYNNYSLLTEIKLQSPSIAVLKQKWQHIVWDTKVVLLQWLQ